MASENKKPVIPRDVPFRYYMGWDSHEIIAHEVASMTCREKASVPVEVRALQQHVSVREANSQTSMRCVHACICMCVRQRVFVCALIRRCAR